MTTKEIEFFDKISSKWDENEILSTPKKINEILSYIGLREGIKVLDLGTGTGVLVPFLSRAVGPFGKITAIDISNGMLEKAIEKFGNLENVNFKLQDFEEVSPEGRYDLIILYCVYPHLHNPEKTLRRLVDNNLLPDGRLMVAFPSDEHFINNIHKERKAESELLPSAPVLSRRFLNWGLNSKVLAYSPELYIIEIQKN